MTKEKIYLIATPIGNLGDITLRALEVIETLDVLVCEDTRVTSGLIESYKKKGLISNTPKYFVYNDFNEGRVTSKIIEMIKQGDVVGLVSDAGMPTISDPGYKIVRACYDQGLEVEVIPGASSVSTALAKSGLGGESYLFVGFLPKKKIKRSKLINNIGAALATFKALRVVIYVSPHKIVKDLDDLEQGLEGIEVVGVLLREMTKMYEERLEGSIKEIRDLVSENARGEMVLVIAKLQKRAP